MRIYTVKTMSDNKNVDARFLTKRFGLNYG